MLARAFELLSGDAGPAPEWFGPYAAAGRRTALARRPGGTVADALNAALLHPIALAAGPLRFVPQQELPDGEPYEAFIARTACVPTRDHPHDLFNGLVWQCFPALKRHLNEQQAREIERRGIGPTRGAVRDALTLFDENAVLLQAPETLVEALRSRDWRALFVDRRQAWEDAQLIVFGHALMEKLWLSPHKSVTAHAWPVPPQAEPEGHLVAALTPERLAARSHLPLPVFGVPGWCAANESPTFYEDTQVFRPLPR